MSSRSLRPIALALALATLPATAAAQPSTLSAGDRVRIRVGDDRATYRLVGSSADTLIVTRDGGATAARIPLAHVTRLERSLGRHSRARGFGRGMLIGSLAGLGAGVAVGASATGGDDVTGLDGMVAGAVALSLTATGAVAGGLVGMALPGERWEGIATAPRVTLAPMHGGVGVRVAF